MDGKGKISWKKERIKNNSTDVKNAKNEGTIKERQKKRKTQRKRAENERYGKRAFEERKVKSENIKGKIKLIKEVETEN